MLHTHLLKIRAPMTMPMLLKELENKLKHPPGAVLVHSPLLDKVQTQLSSGYQALGTTSKMSKTTSSSPPLLA